MDKRGEARSIHLAPPKHRRICVAQILHLFAFGFDMSNAICRRLINNGRSSNRMPCTSEPTLRRDRNAIRIRESRTKFLDKPSALVWCRIHKADFARVPSSIFSNTANRKSDDPIAVNM
jgi:hypothetical protein